MSMMMGLFVTIHFSLLLICLLPCLASNAFINLIDFVQLQASYLNFILLFIFLQICFFIQASQKKKGKEITITLDDPFFLDSLCLKLSPQKPKIGAWDHVVSLTCYHFPTSRLFQFIRFFVLAKLKISLVIVLSLTKMEATRKEKIIKTKTKVQK